MRLFHESQSWCKVMHIVHSKSPVQLATCHGGHLKAFSFIILNTDFSFSTNITPQFNHSFLLKAQKLLNHTQNSPLEGFINTVCIEFHPNGMSLELNIPMLSISVPSQLPNLFLCFYTNEIWRPNEAAINTTLFLSFLLSGPPPSTSPLPLWRQTARQRWWVADVNSNQSLLSLRIYSTLTNTHTQSIWAAIMGLMAIDWRSELA